MIHFTALSIAYWNEAVDNYDVSEREIQSCLKEGLIKESDIPRREGKRQKYWITEKGLELFQTTESYKTSSPNLNH